MTIEELIVKIQNESSTLRACLEEIANHPELGAQLAGIAKSGLAPQNKEPNLIKDSSSVL
jgi:hypothetical protein